MEFILPKRFEVIAISESQLGTRPDNNGEWYYYEDIDPLFANIQAENKKLREHLSKYGEHRFDCLIGDEEKCTCGLERALKGE